MKQIDRVERTKKNISLALYALVLRKPYEEISISDICRKANVSRVSFYHYYDTKDDILIQFSDEKFAEFFDDIAKKDSISFEELITEMFIYLKSISRQLTMLRYARKEDILLAQFHSYGKYIFAHALTGNVVKDKKNPYLLPFWVGGLFAVIMQWLDEGMATPPEIVAKQVFNIVK